MKAFNLFFLYLLFTAIYILANPLDCFGTKTDDLKQCKPKIVKKAPKDVNAMTLSPDDHKNFYERTKKRLADAKQAAHYSRNTGAPGTEIPPTRTIAYMEHNLKVLDKVKPGDKIAFSSSKSGRNRVYHPVKEGKLDRIKSFFSSK